MIKFVRIASTLTLGAALVFNAWAADSTKADAVALVNSTVAHLGKVGPEQGAKDINAGVQWKVKGMNVIFNDMKGQVLASSLNDKLVGKQTLEMRDPSGKAFVKEFTAAAQKGEGWVDYQFMNPETKKLEDRSMFVKKAPGFEGYVGVAITKQ